MNEVSVIGEENILKLMKPVKDIQELVFDFDKINGYAMVKAAQMAKKTDRDMMIPSLSMTFQVMIASAATGIKYDDLLALGGADFVAMTNKVLRFLNGVGE